MAIALPAVAFAEGGLPMAEEWTLRLDGGRIFNSVVIFAIVGYLVMKYGVPVLEKRAKDIGDDFENLEKATKSARAKLKEYEEKLAHIEKEAIKVKDDAAAEAALIREKLLAEAEENANRMVERATAQIELEIERAKEDLRKKALLEAIELSEKIIAENLGDDDQKRLVGIYLEKMEGIN
jgi:F-type H+-transporting ATPase subunit b